MEELMLAVEFGYRACEKGQNLEETRLKFAELYDTPAKPQPTTPKLPTAGYLKDRLKFLCEADKALVRDVIEYALTNERDPLVNEVCAQLGIDK